MELVTCTIVLGLFQRLSRWHTENRIYLNMPKDDNEMCLYLLLPPRRHIQGALSLSSDRGGQGSIRRQFVWYL